MLSRDFLDVCKVRFESENRWTECLEAEHPFLRPLIQVEADGRAVTLKGTVRSLALRQEAARAAWSAPGVEKVDNRIAVNSVAM